MQRQPDGFTFVEPLPDCFGDDDHRPVHVIKYPGSPTMYWCTCGKGWTLSEIPRHGKAATA
jgi:hypothetical protein